MLFCLKVGALVLFPKESLATPINELEARDDTLGAWRRRINFALRTTYATLFEKLDKLILLAAPNFEVVVGWRREQEQQLRADLKRRGLDMQRSMEDSEIDQFVRHYERLTRHILEEMPTRASLVLHLNADRQRIWQSVL